MMTDRAKNLVSGLSRRHLLAALGAAMVLPPAAVFAQGTCGSAKLAGTPECDPTPAKLPFDPTSWKTVHVDIHCQVADYAKEAAFYGALMNWKIRSDDGSHAVLDIGDWGSLILRGGYQAPAKPQPAAASATAPQLGVYDSLGWGITPWNVKKVEAELRKRGLDPVADDSMGFESFRVTDPEGFVFHVSDGRRELRGQKMAKGKPPANPPFEPTDWKTVWLDHISFEVGDYKKMVAFYTALLGWSPGTDEGSQNQCEIGDIGDMTIRRRRGAPAGSPTPVPSISHFSYGISPFDPDQVKAELEKRGLPARMDTGGKGDIHLPSAPYKSYHTVTPNGFNLQISAATERTRILSSLD